MSIARDKEREAKRVANGGKSAADIFAARLRLYAEVEHLRSFFMLWCEMHRTINMPNAHDADKLKAATDLVEKARVLKEFYA